MSSAHMQRTGIASSRSTQAATPSDGRGVCGSTGQRGEDDATGVEGSRAGDRYGVLCARIGAAELTEVAAVGGALGMEGEPRRGVCCCDADALGGARQAVPLRGVEFGGRFGDGEFDVKRSGGCCIVAIEQSVWLRFKWRKEMSSS